ncbi:transposase [Bradyrhizobium sp. 179]|nr:transposase [Bradyrhizobium sp. 179]
MGKPYSLDLRKRVVAAIEGGMSRNQAAKQFGVAISTAIGWMQRVEETGSVEPGQMGGHKPKAVSGDHAVWLSQRMKDGDFTIRGLVAELAGRGLKVDYHSVWDFVHAEKLSFKKAWRLANAIDPRSRGGEPSGQSIKIASRLSGWSSSTRLGPGPIWRHCGDGRRAATDFTRRFPTAGLHLRGMCQLPQKLRLSKLMPHALVHEFIDILRRSRHPPSRLQRSEIASRSREPLSPLPKIDDPCTSASTHRRHHELSSGANASRPPCRDRL